MDTVYLPGTIRERITDLMNEHNMTQADLAFQINSSPSSISRFLNTNTDSLSYSKILRIARVFDVSADFLLGLTDTPRVTDFKMQELGLSQQAILNLKNRKVNTRVLSLLLETGEFMDVTYQIAKVTERYSCIANMQQNHGGIRHITGTGGRMQLNMTQFLSIQNGFMLAVKRIWQQMDMAHSKTSHTLRRCTHTRPERDGAHGTDQ